MILWVAKVLAEYGSKYLSPLIDDRHATAVA